jgi:hypothetical protein
VDGEDNLKPDVNWSTVAVPTLSPFSNIKDYVDSLCSLALEDSRQAGWYDRCELALNGEANTKLRKAIPIAVLREFGVFFTSVSLANKLLAHSEILASSASYHDPACGMGDLLLAAARQLPVKKTLTGTLRAWSTRLSGTDLHAEFIRAAKARLFILARLLHGGADVKNISINDYFENIKTGNGVNTSTALDRAKCIVINPPFGAVNAPPECTWASGRITQAASFLIDVLKQLRSGTEVLAILPEVLRSGSFSHHWRSAVACLAEVHIVEPYGLFDLNTDIDVFLLRITRKSSRKQTQEGWPTSNEQHHSIVSDRFNVHIGRVVPHRDKKEGKSYPYIHARSVRPWSVMKEFDETLRHQAEGYQPPFVVVRRTSRPEQPHRAVATIIAGEVPVAVENHLIVCLPKDGSIASCEALMKQFALDKTDQYLNERIRCRHLTVKAIREVPFDTDMP